LFQRAITESGPCGEPLPSLAGAQASGDAIVSALGCAESSDAASVACATHTDELQFLFTLASTPSTLSNAEKKLAGVMQNYWSSFARSGTPNSLQTPTWAPFSIATGNVQSLNTPRPGLELGFAAQHHCNFWIAVLEQTILAGVATDLTSAGIVQ
jgi:carboxylesterase type B